MSELVILARNREDTRQLAQRVARALSRSAVVGLTGNLGSGKTTFAQDLAGHLGVPDVLTSPTFTILNEYYRSDGGYFIHADLYRLESVAEATGLGLRDYFSHPDTVTIIEWADKYPQLFPQSTVWLHWELVDDYRVVTVRTTDEVFLRRLEQFI